MPHSFENPFIAKPSSLNPDQAEFLKKYASASEEQLQKAGLSREAKPNSPDPAEEAVSLKEVASVEEKETYLNEEVNLDGVVIKRADALKIQNILKKLNQQRAQDGQPELTLGQEIKLDRV